MWYVFLQPVAFVILFIGGLAETNRAPFDLPEAEQELTGGFHTEYSGMRFALFFLAEYANMIVVSAVAATLFFGGWLRPFPNVPALWLLGYVPGWVWFLVKTFVFLYIFIWIRATLPRYRYDQLMRLGWKVLIPLAIANLVVTAILKVLCCRWRRMLESLVFYSLAAFILGFGVLVVTARNTVHCVLFLVANFLCVAVVYVLLARGVPGGDPDSRLRRRHRRAVSVRRDAGQPAARARHAARPAPAVAARASSWRR